MGGLGEGSAARRSLRAFLVVVVVVVALLAHPGATRAKKGLRFLFRAPCGNTTTVFSELGSASFTDSPVSRKWLAQPDFARPAPENPCEERALWFPAQLAVSSFALLDTALWAPPKPVDL